MSTPKRKPSTKKKPTKESPFFQPFTALAPKKKATKAAAPKPKSTPVGAPPRAEPQSMSDADILAVYMAGVRSLDGRTLRIPKTASRVEKGAPKAGPALDLDEPARHRLHALVTEGLRFDTTDDGERLEGRRLDIDPRDLRKLRHGRFAIDGKLDLHGKSASEARSAVEAFIKKRSADGDRVVLIIHGKGNHSPRGQAVLRGEIGAWLSQGQAARCVAAFATAREEDGGHGALLVLLAR